MNASQSGQRRRVLPRMALRQYGVLFATYLGSQCFSVACMVFLLVSSIVLELLGPQIIRAFIDDVQHNSAIQSLTTQAIFYLVVAIGGRLVSAGASYFSENVGWNATNQLRADLMYRCLKLDHSFHTAHTPGELLARVDGDVEILSHFFSQFVIRFLGCGLLVVGVLLLMARESIWFGIVMTAIFLLGNIILLYIQKIAITYYKLHLQTQAELSSFWGEVFTCLEDIASCGAVCYILRRYFRLQRQEDAAEMKRTAFWAAFEGAEVVLEALSLLITLILGALFFVQGQFTIATVVMLLLYTGQLLAYIYDMAEQLSSFQQAVASLERINEIYHTQSRVQDGPGVDFPVGALSVSFEDVSFAYEKGQPVLQDISFRLAAGEIMGLIGRTASGKTTLIRLLMRFYDPTCGSVFLGGQDLRQARLDDLRRRIGLVTQDVQLFRGTLRDNLTLFTESISDQRILQAIERLGITEWYRRLPQGLDTALSSDGGGLSAGEAQLLACIRVFLQDPQLIILDEATARLDPATEKILIRATRQLMAGRTALVIAHRLSTIERVDQVMVLAEGRMLEYAPRHMLAKDPASYYYKLLRLAHSEEMLP
ncbi:ABC transporter ATP-binding protein [Ktedonosporobacter rubrisoli]|uniref:ABC transporter ATP-binding protein n=1 Tax=Ktedonosporobacter rubrisoli TaxID=2509675 RepID=A0A4P6JJ61_KTERU|nr:ABC transporter ATP-binding protein [Ktedonosporobacter rubrisoli]QBD75147.1 ABC transporter ATP-binding protein [Ktedonosporobacter rubrisoli]